MVSYVPRYELKTLSQPTQNYNKFNTELNHDTFKADTCQFLPESYLKENRSIKARHTTLSTRYRERLFQQNSLFFYGIYQSSNLVYVNFNSVTVVHI